MNLLSDKKIGLLKSAKCYASSISQEITVAKQCWDRIIISFNLTC